MMLGGCLLIANSQGWMPVTAQSTRTTARLSEAERALVGGSRAEFVRSGMSSRYFDRHFTLVKVVNQPGDRRVVWKFSVNGHSTTVTDVLGYYTKDGRRVDTHSVTAALRATSDINRTISRRKANQIMQQCIGNFRNAVVEFRAADAGGARLFLTAEALPQNTGQNKDQPTPENPPVESSDADPIKKKGPRRPAIVVGSVDLQTGKCTKGKLTVGSQT